MNKIARALDFAPLLCKTGTFLSQCEKYRGAKMQIHKLVRRIIKPESNCCGRCDLFAHKWLLLFNRGGSIGEMEECIKNTCLPFANIFGMI